jgi:hypothetical protein
LNSNSAAVMGLALRSTCFKSEVERSTRYQPSAECPVSARL